MAKLYVCGISSIGCTEIRDVTYKFFITRYLTKGTDISKYGFSHYSALAPSKELVDGYLSLKRKGMWNQEAFDNWYTNQFRDLIKTDNYMRGALNHVYKLLKAGNSVVLGCYCHDKNMCHRSIIGSEYERLGFEVVYI